MLTKKQINKLLDMVLSHHDREAFIERLEDHLLNEIELDGHRLIQAFIEGDVDNIILALTGWTMESLMKKAQIIPDSEHCFYSTMEQQYQDIAIREFPWEKKYQWKLKDYTHEYCPNCDNEVVIYSDKTTLCPKCGKPLLPCSMCESCDPANCPYETADNTPTQAVEISKAEVEWYWSSEEEWSK